MKSTVYKRMAILGLIIALSAIFVLAMGIRALSGQAPIQVEYDIVVNAPEGVSGGVFAVNVGTGEEHLNTGDVDCNGITQFLDINLLFQAVVNQVAIPSCTAGPVIVTIADIRMPDYGVTGKDIGLTSAQFSFADGRFIWEKEMDDFVVATVILDMPVPAIVPIVIQSLQFDDDQGNSLTPIFQVRLVR